MDQPELRHLLDRWFDAEDDGILSVVLAELTSVMVPTAATLRVLGAPAIDELRQELIARLLLRDGGRLRGAENPGAYARVAWRNAQHDALRLWMPRLKTLQSIAQDAAGTPSAEMPAERLLDVERAVEIAAELDGKARLAILLTTRPDRISEQDWASLTCDLPPPPPPRPSVPLDREEAAALLFPTEEPSADTRQQLNSFDKAFRRAIERIRARMGVA